MSAPFTLVEEWFGSRVYDHAAGRTLAFDPALTALLVGALDRSVGEQIDAIADGPTRERYARAAEALYADGLFTYDLRFAGRVLRPPRTQGFLTGPLSVHLEVTAHCDLACAHCFAGELPRAERPLGLADLDRLFAELASLGSFRLNLSGGEPTLRRDFFELVDLALGHGLSPAVTTNAMRVTPAMAKAFGGRKLLWLNVSFDGATRATHEAIRGPETFDTLCENTRRLAAETPVTLAFTVMRHNAHELEAAAALARELGAAGAVFRPMYPVGKALSNRHLLPSVDDYDRATQALGALSGCATRYGPRQRAQASELDPDTLGCGAGSTQASITVGGRVNPCGYLGAAFEAGTVRDTPFGQIWREGESFQQLRALHRTLGGCRARALDHTGRVDGDDPWDAPSAGLHSDSMLVQIRTKGRP